MGELEPGKHMCGVCGESMSREELAKHRAEVHLGLDHVSARAAKKVALYTVPAGSILVLIILLEGFSVSWLGLPLILWALFVFVILLIPVIAVVLKPSSEAYANALFRCWVCDARIPHRRLGQHLRQNHPDEAPDYLLAETTYAAVAVLLPLTVLLPQLWRFMDPSLPLYSFLGPTPSP